MHWLYTFLFAVLTWLISNTWGYLSFQGEFWFTSYSLIGSIPVTGVSAILFYYAYPKLSLYRYLWLWVNSLNALFIMYCTWELGSPLGFIGGFVAFPVLYVLFYKSSARWRLARQQGYWLTPNFNITQWCKQVIQESTNSALYIVILFFALLLVLWELEYMGVETTSIWVQIILLCSTVFALSYLQLKHLLEAVILLGSLGLLGYAMWQFF